ncbi:MAG: hypothetical protein QXO70_04360 [Candidatus Pacearchaeota archaeon]
MKKIILLSAVFLLMSNVLAISIDMEETYLPRQTVIKKISGEILDVLTRENLEFRRGHVKIPLESDLKRIGEDYYIWFITPTLENNYTLVIKDIAITTGGFVKRVDYERNFTVKGNMSYSIKPGFVYTSNDFEIIVQVYEDNKKTITTNFLEEKAQDFILKPGENILKFSIKNVNETGLYNITIGDYNVPAYIMPNKTFYRVINETNVSEITIRYDEKNYTKKTRQVYCYEYPGKICAKDEICSGEIIPTLDGNCCVGGTCGKEEVKGGYAWAGYLIAVIVIIAGLYLWFKYKKTKGSNDVIEKRIGEIEKRKF